MATNAPYYQMRGGQFTNPTNVTASSFAQDHGVGNYDLPVAAPNDALAHDHAAAVATHQDLFSHQTQQSGKNIQTPIVASLEVDNHHFVELLEAATTAAAGQANMRENTSALTEVGGGTSKGNGKRKRSSSSPPPEGAATGDAAPGTKRARVDCPTDPQLHGEEIYARNTSETGSVRPLNETLLNDARAAGVHSAAALFRRSSEKTSRKYTRPPMSKLFISLQLTPENFLHLQAQAKSYMLDPAYPERQNCVGNRGKGDTDMVKLRLFNCVRGFLNEGVGEQYFGEGSEKPGETDTLEAARALGQEKVSNEDKLVWPKDGNKIISLVTPLLRRMVTNERQRMYAIESRKGGAKKNEATPTPDDAQGMNVTVNPGRNLQQLQTTFESPQPLPLAPAQVHGQLLHTPSPSSPVPPTAQLANRDSIMTTHYTELKSAIELFPGEKLMLPAEQPDEPLLNKINIFITKNGHLLRNEKRFPNLPSAPLFHMTWQELKIRVLELVREAMSLYPQLQEDVDRSASIGSETLRDLAVAAMQNENAETMETSVNGANVAPTDALAVSTNARPISGVSLVGSGFEPTPPKSLMSSSLTLPSTTGSVPQYRIGTQTSKGWVDVRSEEEWGAVKRDLAGAVWADKVCCVVITLLP